MRYVAVWLAAFVVLVAKGQSWQQVYDDVMTIGDAGISDAATSDNGGEAGELLQDSYELLEQLADHPLDLNRCTREELEQLPFLSAQQVMDLLEYVYRYGPVRSLGELRMVRSLDHPQLLLLPFFVYAGETADAAAPATPRLDSLLQHGRHTLTETFRVPFYERKGDKNGYLGYPWRHTLRYELSSGQHLRLGLVGAQDAGEPFFAEGNGWGFDAYSYYVQLRRMGRLENVVAGKYRLSAGMGLVLGQSFQLGKLATLQSLGRTVQTIRPHSSRTEADYFQGAAATVRMWRSWSLSLFASFRPTDATLTKAGEAQTLLTGGYHRTPAEMAKKHNTHIASGGTHLACHQGALRLGATAVWSQLDRSLQPQRQTLYRRHYAHGRRFLNMSVDYAYTHHRLSLNGETATDAHGALATANAVSFQPSARLSMMALQRFYSFRYTSLYGHGFGETSRTQNESGIYLGMTWNPLAHLRLQGYADYAYFPWARYQVSLSSHAWDMLLQATWQQRRWTLLARHHSHLQQKDNEAKTALTSDNSHRERLAVAYAAGAWTLKAQLDAVRAVYKQRNAGWMLSQQATIACGRWQLYGLAGYFHTDSYQSRIFLYERQLQHEFNFPSFYGKGLRVCAQARLDLGSRLRLSARLGYTNYFDRSAISSGLQLIGHSHQTDLDVQLRLKL